MTAPLILACDTTQGACSVALYQDKALALQLAAMRKGHAEALIPMIEQVMSDADRAMTDIDRLAVTNGPGTFTGTRVGLSAMRGLALALDKPLKAYGSLHVMAEGVEGAECNAPILVAVDARRDVFYAQGFEAQILDAPRARLCPPQALSAEAALALMGETAFGLIGSGAHAVHEMAVSLGRETRIIAAPDYPQAVHVAALAAQDTDWDAPPLPSPFYLRPPDASLPNRAKFPARAKS
jgi:tRNA threonylcarbamoyladenosine biosynthesis protein TsaB